MEKVSPKFIVGVDVGYSNLKFTYGVFDPEDNKNITELFRSEIYPSTVQSITEASNICDYKSINNACIVNLNGNEYLTCVTPNVLSSKYDSERIIDDSYPFSDEYLALYLSALLHSGRKEIDLVVVGLPAREYIDEERKERLKQRLTGTFNVTNKTQITVNDVIVIPQPLGAFCAELSQSIPNQEATKFIKNLNFNTSLIIDIGFYSTDWVVMNAKQMEHDFLGSSYNAVSVILKDTQQLLGKKYGIIRNESLLEDAIRTGSYNISMGSSGDINFFADFKEMANRRAEKLVREITAAVRECVTKIDTIIICGGGLDFYKDKISERFNHCNIITADTAVDRNTTVSLNSLGFWVYGFSQIRK